MAFPANLTTVTVVGSFITPEGTPSTGTVTFTASSWLTNSGANLSIPNSAVTKTLGTAGNFSATIPITDDADISPTGWVYTVAEVVDGVSRSYDVTIPGTVVAGGTVYLADLTPAAAAGPEYYSLASSLSIGTVSTLAAGSAATATITGLAPNQTLNLGIPTGPTGAAGSAASIAVGSVTSVANTGTASVTNVGSSSAGTFDFVLRDGPAGATGATGATGAQGPAATVTVGTIGATAYPGPGTVTNSGTSGAAVLDFVLVTGQTGATGATGAAGSAATIAVGTVGTVAYPGPGTVTNSGSSTAGTFDFILVTGDTGPQGATGPTGATGPQGAAGSAATVTVGTVGAVAYPGPGTVTNSGSSSAAVLDFVLVTGQTGATGATGATGPAGSAATVTIGTVGFVAYPGPGTVTNSGSSTNGTFNFTLVTGPQGDLAGLSATAPIDYAANTFSLRYGAGLGTATGGTLVADFFDGSPAALAAAAAAGTSVELARGDHAHARPTAADIGAVGTATAITAGTALAGGGDLSTSRTLNVTLSDATPLAVGTPAAGTAVTPSRADHVHEGTTLSSATPAASDSATGAAGTATTAARADHAHANGIYSLITAAGQVIASSGSATPAVVAVGTADGQVLTWDSASTPKMKWATSAGGGKDDADNIIAVQVFG